MGTGLERGCTPLVAEATDGDGPSADVYVDDDAAPGWYDTTHVQAIQEGVNNATDGDTIFVFNGTYCETVNVNKVIHLIGEESNNTVIDVRGNANGVYVTGGTLNMSGFTVLNFTSHGVNFQSGSDHHIHDSMFESLSGISAIQAFSSVPDVNISGNTMYGVGVAAYMGSCPGWTISDNLIDIKQRAHHGIVGGGPGYGITHNEIMNCGDPSDGGYHQAIDSYQFGSPGGWLIEKNDIHDNEDGIQIEGDGHLIRCNTIRDSTHDGINFASSTANSVIYHNNFLHNARQAYDEGSNAWHNATIQEGNYWSDFDEPGEGAYDNDSDGIVDSPRPVSGGDNQDLYPLTEPYEYGPSADVGIVDAGIHDGDTRYTGADTLNVTIENLGGTTTSGQVNLTLERNTTSGWVETATDSSGYEVDPEAWVESFFDVSYMDDGEYRATFQLRATDGGPWSDNDPGNDVYRATFSVLNRPPVANFTYRPASPTTASAITFTDCSCDPDGSIVNWTWTCGDGNTSYEQNLHHRYTGTGTCTVTLTVTDNDGATDSHAENITIAAPSPPPRSPRPPSLPHSWRLVYFEGPNEWNRTHWDITPATLVCFDLDVAGDAGIVRLHYSIDHGSWTEYREGFNISMGMHSVYYYGVDGNGRHTNTARVVVDVVDSVAPLTTCDVYPPCTKDSSGWHTKAVTVTMSATDRVSGVNVTRYRLNGGPLKEYVQPLKVAADGRYTLRYYSIDRAGNEEAARSATFQIDGTAPSVQFAQPTQGCLYIMGREILPMRQTVIIGEVRLDVNAMDNASGVDHVTFSIDENKVYTVTESPFELVWDRPAFFEHTVSAVAHDRAGNEAIVERDIWIFNL